MHWLLKEVKLSDPKELKARHFHDNHGGALLTRYNNSVQDLVQSLFFPHKPSDVSSSSSSSPSKKPNIMYTPRGFWESKVNHRSFVDSLATKMGIRPGEWERFYEITAKDIRLHGGHALLPRYSSSIYQILRSLYPEHDWMPWKFAKAPKNLADDVALLHSVSPI